MVTVDLTRVEGTETYDRLCRMTNVRMIGDVASYYLSYVRLIAERHPEVRFLCMRRDIGQTVQSWMETSRIKRWRSLYIADRLASLITRTPFYDFENFWMEHSGTKWRRNPVWDKLLPKFDASSKEEAIRTSLSSLRGKRFPPRSLTGRRIQEPVAQQLALVDVEVEIGFFATGESIYDELKRSFRTPILPEEVLEKRQVRMRFCYAGNRSLRQFHGD
jgi:hypothetical protein